MKEIKNDADAWSIACIIFNEVTGLKEKYKTPSDEKVSTNLQFDNLILGLHLRNHDLQNIG